MATSINGTPFNFMALLLCCALVFGSGVLCQSVPGVYILGDSLMDVGNNNYLPLSLIKADYPHYGIDFPARKATGRFSNGKNIADFLAENIGLPSPPPYLSLVAKLKKLSSYNATVTGVSFASAGAGIFNETNELFKESISLTKQVEYFSLVHEDLVQKMGSNGAQAHLSKSLFAIVIGSNDLFVYFNKNFNVSMQCTPQQYIDLMASTLKGLIKRIYGLGARKFVVSGVGVIGCTPEQRKQNNTYDCNMEANYWSMKYNEGLETLLGVLKLELSNFNYSYFDTYGVMNDIIQHPQTYGIIEVKEACCGLGNLNADTFCIPISTYCSNRKNYLFWDLYHPTETASSIFATVTYNGSQQFTHPVNVKQLISV